MSDVTITREDGDQRGTYRAQVPGQEDAGKLTYRKEQGGAVLVADHTFVPGSLRGKGVAGELVRALIADAREQGTKIRPLCSYVVAAFERHPEWADLRA